MTLHSQNVQIDQDDGGGDNHDSDGDENNGMSLNRNQKESERNKLMPISFTTYVYKTQFNEMAVNFRLLI